MCAHGYCTVQMRDASSLALSALLAGIRAASSSRIQACTQPSAGTCEGRSMHAHTLGRTSFRAADLARSALRGPSPAPRAVLCEAQRSRGMVSTQPLTPWAHLISNAKLQQQKEGFAEPLEFRLKGVTFNNDITGESRQELLQQASSGEPVLCFSEPDNPVDPNAVRVVGPRGQLGYITAEETHHFEHVCTPGYLLWAAARQGSSDPILGAEVECTPHLRAFHIQALPTELATAADLSRSLHPAVWRSVEALQLESTFGRCQLTGLQAVPLNASKDDSPAVASAVQPIWSVLEREGVIKLEGFATLCMPAILALNYLDLEALGPEHSPAAEASTGDGGAERAAQTERWADAFEGVQQEAREGAQQRSVCGRMLAALRDEFGSERYLAVARAAAQDALRFGNAVYDARADEPQILRQQLWTEEDAEGFIAFAWNTQERIRDRGFVMDLTHLRELGLQISVPNARCTADALKQIS